MAGLPFRITAEGVSLSAATTKTVISVTAAANNPLRLVRWGITFKGTSTTAAPGRVRLKRMTTAGTSTSVTPVKTDDRISGTLQATAFKDFSAEGTLGDVLEPVNVHPQTGYVSGVYDSVAVAGSSRLGLDCNFADAVTCDAWMEFEE